jgi:hypothetical protein
MYGGACTSRQYVTIMYFMNDEEIGKITEALRKVPIVEFGIYQIVITNKRAQKVSVIPMSGKISKVVIEQNQKKEHIEKVR